jgi:hypothetical protein
LTSRVMSSLTFQVMGEVLIDRLQGLRTVDLNSRGIDSVFT